MAHGLKRPLERLLVRSGVAGWIGRTLGRQVLILGYHDVVPHGERAVGNLTLHIDQSAFSEHLDRLLQTHDVVSLTDLDPGQPTAPEPRRPQAVITFDDAYAGAVHVGVDELVRRGLPGTVFVAPGLLGAEGFWWDRLTPLDGPIDPHVKRHARHALAGKQADVLAWAEPRMPLTTIPPHCRPATVEAVLAAARKPGITLASHTWSHPNLPRLPGAERSEEMERARRWLLDRTDSYVDWIAYPYGLADSATIQEAAARYTGAVLAAGGLAMIRGRWTSGSHDRPRVTGPRGLTPDGLSLRTAGLVR